MTPLLLSSNMADSKAPFITRPGEVRRRDVVARLSGEKVSKELANYRVGSDAKNGKVCFECAHYEQPDSDTSSCRRVLGPVEARDVCDLFTDNTYNKPGAMKRSTANIKVNIQL